MKINQWLGSVLCVAMLFGGSASASYSTNIPDLPTKTVSVNDLGNEWYSNSVSYMVKNGIVSGDVDGSFRPNDKVTKAEAVAIICRAFVNKNITNATTEHWAKPYAKELFNRFILKKEELYYFSMDGADDFISREVVASLLIKAKNITAVNISLYPSAAGNNFSDWDEVSLPYKSSVLTAFLSGYFNGDLSKSFHPSDGITRAEFCEILYRAMITNPSPVIPHPDIMSCVPIQFESDEAATDKDSALVSLSKLPEGFLRKFSSDGWSIHLTSSNMDSVLGAEYSAASGLAIPSDKEIYVKVGGYLSDSNVVLHEIGHYVHYVYDIPNLEQLFESESANLTSLAGRDYCETNAHEFFAEAFKLYFLYGSETLSRFAPETNIVIQNILSEF